MSLISGQVYKRKESCTSAILLNFAAGIPGERARLSDLEDILGNRSFGFFMLICALPNTLPMIGVPGVSTLTGIPLAIVALQMMLGLPRPSLPGWIAGRSISRVNFQQLVGKISPWSRRVERLIRPRWLI